MENKYYTPDLEEFCVGFEYETKLFLGPVEYDPITGKIINEPEHEWGKTKWSEFSSLSNSMNYSEEANGKTTITIPETIQVKHLDREDILECGWMPERILFEDDEGNDTYSDGFVLRKNKDQYYEIIPMEENVFFIQKKWYRNEVTQLCRALFYGTIKNKTELKKLMVQLQINSDEN